MRQDNQANAANSNRSQERERSGLILAVLIFLIALTTSSVVGYILGRSFGPAPLGQVIDTILLTPEKRPERETFHLTGRIFYTDGTPAAGRTLELHSDPVTAVSDSAGGFLFPNIPRGGHTIYVLDDSGAAVVRRDIEVVRSSEAKTVSIDLEDSGTYVIELSMDIRVLEIEIELDAQTLRINPESITYAAYDGLVITPAGVASILDGVVVTPGGNIYLSDGNIVLPGGTRTDPTYLIQPTETVLVNQPVSAGGVHVAADGTVMLPDSTVIEPGGLITPSAGAPDTPGPGGVIVGGGTLTPIGGQTAAGEESSLPGETAANENQQENLPPADASTASDGPVDFEAPSASEDVSESGGTESGGTAQTGAPGGTTASDNGGSGGDGGGGNSGGGGKPGGNEKPGESGSSGGNEKPGESESSGGSEKPGESESSGGSEKPGESESSGGSETPPAQTDNGTLKAMDGKKDGSFIPWEKNSIIDLFYNRETGEAVRMEPGSSGYYLFRLENTRKEPLAVTVSIEENGNSAHIPLQFTLRPQGRDADGVSGTLGSGRALSLKTQIAGNDDVIYRLDWEWPFEGGQDDVDTEAGSRGGAYTLKLSIYAEGGE